MRKCERCSADISQRHALARYCTDECSRAASKDRERARVEQSRQPRMCMRCNGDMSHRPRHARYCSDLCRYQTRQCRGCDTDIPAGSTRSSYCSIECRDGLSREKAAARRGGISLERWRELMSGGCMACGSFESLHLDHDHSCCDDVTRLCGKCVRGVLCHGCNTAEGLLKGDPTRALQLAAYMMRNEDVIQLAREGFDGIP